jgi:23S rRNA (uracil1939-C5)-methyltransferase
MPQPNAESDSSSQSTPSVWRGDIRSISQDGLGVGTVELEEKGRLLHRPIFIPFTAPGDTIEAAVVRSKGKYYHGRLLQVLNPSPHRVPPICPHYMACGGCNLEHISYEEQLRQKAHQVEFLLSRKRIVLPHEISVLPAKQQHKYRRRSKIAIHIENGKVTAGFREFRSHDIVEIKECFIVTQEILSFIRLLNSSTAKEGVGPITVEAMVVAGDSGKLGVLVLLAETPTEAHVPVKEFFDDIYGHNRSVIGNLFFEEAPGEYKTSGQVQEHLSYTTAGLAFFFSPEVFIQANTSTNEMLVQRVIDHLLLSTDEGVPNTVLDLYCGIGNFSLPAALHAAAVVGVEGHERSVELAKVNASNNNITNARFLHAPIEDYMKEHALMARDGTPDETHPLPTHIIIDPPRTGCTQPVIRGLLASGANSIIYVSCDPDTLASDLEMLSEKYSVADIVGVDMFPDISHLETVVLLRRK